MNKKLNRNSNRDSNKKTFKKITKRTPEAPRKPAQTSETLRKPAQTVTNVSEKVSERITKSSGTKLIIKAIGGYGVIGRNMTVVQYGNESVILDMGLYLNRYISFQESDEEMTSEALIDDEALPNDRKFFAEYGHTVKAIVIGHAHLDHTGGIRFLASKYKCPIVASPYTSRIIQKMSYDDHWQLENKLIPLNINSSYKVSENITVELVGVTHSTLQTAITVIHTPAGSVVYTLDYKLDNNPPFGQKTNMPRLRELGKEHVVVLLPDCTRADEEGHTFSEKVARSMLKDTLLGLQDKHHAIVATTFASNINRLHSIIDMGELIGREVVFLGRSFSRWIGAAEELGLVNFSKRAKILRSGQEYKRFLKVANANRGKYLMIMTGNQGEPNAMLIRVAKGETPFEFMPGDSVIFSCQVIPDPMIQANRRNLEEKLHRKKVRIFKDVHASGHAKKEDHRDIIKLLRPDNIIPAHGTTPKHAAMVDLAAEIGYSLGKNIHLLQEGQEIAL